MTEVALLREIAESLATIAAGGGGGGGGGITQAQADLRYLRINGAQTNDGATMIQALGNLGLTIKANGDAITLDSDIQASTEIPLQATTP